MRREPDLLRLRVDLQVCGGGGGLRGGRWRQRGDQRGIEGGWRTMEVDGWKLFIY